MPLGLVHPIFYGSISFSLNGTRRSCPNSLAHEADTLACTLPCLVKKVAGECSGATYTPLCHVPGWKYTPLQRANGVHIECCASALNAVRCLAESPIKKLSGWDACVHCPRLRAQGKEVNSVLLNHTLPAVM